jgi:hypothetical protein
MAARSDLPDCGSGRKENVVLFRARQHTRRRPDESRKEHVTGFLSWGKLMPRYAARRRGGNESAGKAEAGERKSVMCPFSWYWPTAESRSPEASWAKVLVLCSVLSGIALADWGKTFDKSSSDNTLRELNSPVLCCAGARDSLVMRRKEDGRQASLRFAVSPAPVPRP